MILYEHPFNERTRTYLRLEHLLQRLGELMARETPLDHHYALVNMFELLDMAGRSELRSDLLRDLDRLRAMINGYRGNPAISEALLNGLLAQLDTAHGRLNQQTGKPGHECLDQEWLMSVRSRAFIPGGTCAFDLPAYHAWQHRPATERCADLLRWSDTLHPQAEALVLVLKLLRESAAPQKMLASGGQFQQTLSQNRSYQLLRLRLDPSLNVVPEISGNRLVVSVRMMHVQPDGKLVMARDDVPFEMTLCA